jgi:cell division protein ZapB
MSEELFNELEGRIDSLVKGLLDLKLENDRLKQDNDRLTGEREGFKSRIDSILEKLAGVC